MSEPTAAELAFLEPRLSNRWWRLSNLYWIKDAHGRIVRFRPNWAQRAFYASLYWLNVVLKVRQIGISTFVGILILDRCLFNSSQTCGIIDRTDPDAVKKLKKIEAVYDLLDHAGDDGKDMRTAALGQKIKEWARKVKSNDHLLKFSNGSEIWCGVTLRGDTINFLHVSELGYIAHEDPKRATEIAAGSFNTVHAGNFIVIESTHEGGRGGLNYEMIRLAQRFPADPTRRTMLDWAFHFFPWYKEPSYTLPLAGPLSLSINDARHLAELEKATGITLAPEQKLWWAKKAAMPKIDMARQYPGTVEEALTATVPGAIYGKEFADLRANGRVVPFEADRGYALFAFWDLGVSDFMCIWFLQFIGLDIRWWAYYTSVGDTVGAAIAACLERERLFGGPIRRHFVPHDAGKRQLNGLTYVQEMNKAGVQNITVVPVTPDVWIGIKHLRTQLKRSYFNPVHCDVETELPDRRILPGGIAALEGYHSKVETESGAIQEKPVHDQFSHGADAARVFSEAHLRGMLEGISPVEREHSKSRPVAVTGLRTPSTFDRRRAITR